MKKTAVILAGGLGTRLRSVVNDRPKPMALVNDIPFLAHQIDYWRAAGVQRFILSIGYKSNLIVDYFGSSFHGAQIDYVVEDTPIGTGGGLVLAIKQTKLATPFLLLNGDTYFNVELDELIDYSLEKDAELTFSLFKTEDKKRYMGMEINENGQVESLNTVSYAKPYNLANGGVYWVQNPGVLYEYFTNLANPVSFESDILPSILKNGNRLFGFEWEGDFIDIGVPEDYFRAGSILNRVDKIRT